MARGKAIALLMGSFNPVHNGHLAVARYVRDHRLADEVWFVVSPHNPLKNSSELAPFEDRLNMVRLAAEGENGFRVCDIESTLPSPSYTIQTIFALRERYPEHRFTILAGSDIADQLPRWHRSEELRQLVRFLFYPRNQGTASDEMCNAPQLAIDATSLRRAAAEGNLTARELPETVRVYIREHHLYERP